MPRRKGQPNKSEEVRTILGRNPHTPVKEIVSALAERGIKIHPNLVYLIKSKARDKKRRQKHQQFMATGKNAGIGNMVEIVSSVKALAQSTGGIQNLKKLVDVLAQ